jgi:arginine-tRNA-protein transferase
MYDPNEKKRSLGTYSLISEIEHGLAQHKKHHYPGHAYYQNSMYDYKKLFNNMECFDWDISDWAALSRLIK